MVQRLVRLEWPAAMALQRPRLYRPLDDASSRATAPRS